MTRALIVDDEKKSREVLRSLLELYCPEIEIMAATADIPTSLVAIKEYKPDLVFLDISLKDGDSFMILDTLDSIDFNIIFITAFDEYSVKALNYSGIPCLFKPVDIEELVGIIKQVTKEEKTETALRYSFANQLLKSRFSQIPILNQEGMILLNLGEISSIQKADKYTKIYLQNGKELISKRPFAKFLEILPKLSFFPVDQNCYINLHQVDTPPERFRNRIIMKNGKKISLDKKKVLLFWELFKKI